MTQTGPILSVAVKRPTYERLQRYATPFRGSDRGTPDKVLVALLDEVDGIVAAYRGDATAGLLDRVQRLAALRLPADPQPPGLVANVLFDEPPPALAEAIADDVPDSARLDGDSVWWDVDGYLAVWDEDDPDSGPLFVMYAAADGSAATLFAPDCPDVGELERRIHRDLSGDFTIDDHGDAVAPQQRRRLLAEYDVTGLTEDEIDYLAGEVDAQAEHSDGHPDVPSVSVVVAPPLPDRASVSGAAS